MMPEPERLTVPELVAEINRHCLGDETVEDVMAMADGLSILDTRVHLSKAEYANLGLKIGYTWIKRLIKIGRDDKLRDSDNWPRLPAGRSHLVELRLMKKERFLRGLEPDPERNNEIVIHPAANREDLRLYRIINEPIKAPKRKPTVLLVILPAEEPDDIVSVVETIREAAFSEGCSFLAAEVVSRKKKETVTGHHTTKAPNRDNWSDNTPWPEPERHAPEQRVTVSEETIWTIAQTERIERPPKEGKDDDF